MDVLALVLSGPVGAPVVVPRRLSLEVAPGCGRLRLDAPPVDERWRASVDNGWRAALALAGRDDVDVRLRVASGAPLAGASAGLAVGLGALALLSGGRAPGLHFSTGGVREDGFLEGGASARVKGEAAGILAPQLGGRDPPFLCPPLPEPPALEGVRLVMAADLGSAFARLDPDAYARLAGRHEALRRVAVDDVELDEPFALVRAARPLGLPPRAGFVRVRQALDPHVPPASAEVALGARGLLLWRTTAPADEGLAASIPRLWESARAASALPG